MSETADGWPVLLGRCLTSVEGLTKFYQERERERDRVVCWRQHRFSLLRIQPSALVTQGREERVLYRTETTHPWPHSGVVFFMTPDRDLELEKLYKHTHFHTHVVSSASNLCLLEHWTWYLIHHMSHHLRLRPRAHGHVQAAQAGEDNCGKINK